MHPATMQALAAQRGRDMRRNDIAAQRARRSQLGQQHGQFRAREPARAALGTRFCQTLAVTSNSDTAARATPARSPLRMPQATA